MHRDLKSDNIFVTLNERKEIAQVAIGDFDCAKAVSRQSAAKTVLGVRESLLLKLFIYLFI